MERELWPVLYRTVRDVARDFQQKYVQIPAWVLLLTMLWAALHDRPILWACDHSNWSTTKLRPRKLPSPSTMSRRVDSIGVGLLWRAVEGRLREMSATDPSLISFLDAKPLPVGGSTKDPDARFGRAAGCMAKGYKLHTIWSNRSMPETWELTPLNQAETKVAHRLIDQLDQGGYLLGDANYDANDLYDAAAERGYQLVAPLPKKSASGAGKGHHYQSPHRLRSIAMMQGRFGRVLFRLRPAIERDFGNATSFGGGLSPLPAWIRGLDRVRTWVWAKLLINAVRILKLKDLGQP